MKQTITFSELNAVQKETAQKITAQAQAMGLTPKEIEIAIKVAFLESSLGQLSGKNPSSSATGIYQYTVGTWSDRYANLGAREDDSNQITAFLTDFKTWRERWNDKTNQDIPRDKITFSEYVYIKHHDGQYYSGDFINAPGRIIWNKYDFHFA